MMAAIPFPPAAIVAAPFRLGTKVLLMKSLYCLGIAAVLALGSVAQAEKPAGDECLAKGDSLGAFYVTKSAGAEDDGVEAGKSLCYRCKYSSRPQVIVFTRSTDKKIANLARRLDKAVSEHKEERLAAFVNVLGDDAEKLDAQAKKLAARTKVENIPFVVPNDHKMGPKGYKLSSKSDVTVLLAVDGTIEAAHTFASAEELKINAVIKDIAKIIN